jgi:hypothetical protein
MNILGLTALDSSIQFINPAKNARLNSYEGKTIMDCITIRERENAAK